MPEESVCVEFPAMVHGWVTRGDDGADEGVARDQANALDRCASFIQDHAGGELAAGVPAPSKL